MNGAGEAWHDDMDLEDHHRFMKEIRAKNRMGFDLIVATLATAYVASHFFRAANVTIGLDLMRDLAIGPEA